MADSPEAKLMRGLESLDVKISQTLYERVFTRQGPGNVFFLSDRALVVGQFKKKLEDAKKDLEELNRQKQDAV
ncbi:hypothetical protein pdam_00005748 [Pocillopora damicornis]|uniref:Prefoldin subunit 1 n=1 Tax=Pocillopora damicornis TaxID=46731 RepID=A0A3M6UV43_POCDA|nr:hypothetical protein pdam_00005748 [Pocillopora damicornis]